MTPTAPSYQTILYDEAGPGIARITLNRPEALNAFTGELMGELAQAMNRAGQDETVKCIIITGAGRAFGAGQDLRANPQAITDLQSWLEKVYRPTLAALQAVRQPTIAMVNGLAAGASFSLTLACDFRIASTKARFIPAFGKIALVPDSGMTYYLPRLVGLGRALELLGTGRDLSGEEALQWGLVNRVSPPEELEATTLAFARQVAQVSPLAFSLTRRLFLDNADGDLMTALGREEAAQGQAGSSQDFQEGLAAFEQKRPPQFKGS